MYMQQASSIKGAPQGLLSSAQWDSSGAEDMSDGSDVSSVECAIS